MATLLELRSIFLDSDFQSKVEAALIIAAKDLLDATPSTDEQAWAAIVFSAPKVEAKKAMLAVIAEFNDLSVPAILGATDSAIKTEVAAVVPVLVVAYTASKSV